MCGPVVKMRGPGRPSAATILRNSTNFSFHCPGSRNAVMPCASCRSASRGSFSMWKCRSISPGITVLPARSTPRHSPAPPPSPQGRPRLCARPAGRCARSRSARRRCRRRCARCRARARGVAAAATAAVRAMKTNRFAKRIGVSRHSRQPQPSGCAEATHFREAWLPPGERARLQAEGCVKRSIRFTPHPNSGPRIANSVNGAHARCSRKRARSPHADRAGAVLQAGRRSQAVNSSVVVGIDDDRLAVRMVKRSASPARLRSAGWRRPPGQPDRTGGQSVRIACANRGTAGAPRVLGSRAVDAFEQPRADAAKDGRVDAGDLRKIGRLQTVRPRSRPRPSSDGGPDVPGQRRFQREVMTPYSGRPSGVASSRIGSSVGVRPSPPRADGRRGHGRDIRRDQHHRNPAAVA